MALPSREADFVQIYLAMEEKEDKADFKAQNLIGTFKQSFYKMSYTMHPANIPGEAQGKSSNESWAGKQASKDYPDAAQKANIIMTTMDGWSTLALPNLSIADLRQRTHISRLVIFNKSLACTRSTPKRTNRPSTFRLSFSIATCIASLSLSAQQT